MSPFLSQIVLVWLISLCLVLGTFAGRAKDGVQRVLALDAMTFVIVGLLAVLAITRRQAAFLDIALMMALVGFVQTVATVTALLRQEGEK